MLDPDLVAVILSVLAVSGTLAGVVLSSTLNTRQWKNQLVFQRKIDTINEFLVALMASHRAVSARIVFTNQSTPQEVDQKIETTVAKFQQSSVYLDQSDYSIMEAAWLKEKFFISAWMFSLQVNLVDDVNELNQTYNAAYTRLRTILRNP